MSRPPCAGFAEARSALVDGALRDADRERLLVHLVDCSACREDVAELRSVAALLRQGRTPAPPPIDLTARLAAIGATPTHLPARSATTPRPLRRVAAGLAAVATLAVATGLVGYLAAPPVTGTAVSDPVGTARAELGGALGQLPLAPEAWAALGELPAAGLQPTVSTEPAAPTGAVLDEATAAARLRRAAEAADTTSYSGRQAVWRATRDGGRGTEVQVEFRSGQGSQVSVLAGGTARVRSFLPTTTTTRATDLAQPDLVRQGYRLSGQAGGQVTGRPATLVQAARSGRVVVRWWLDDATGMVLRQATYDAAGSPYAVVGFTALALQPDAPMLSHLPVKLSVAPGGTTLTPGHSAALHAAGWSCPDRVAGLPLLRLRADAATGPRTVQATYGDGVSTLAVVEQRGWLQDPPAGASWDDVLGGWVTPGAVTTVTWSSADSVFTVVSDGPPDLVAQAVRALPREEPLDRTTLGRTEAGWVRILAELKG